MLSVSKITVTMEGGVGKRTVPLLITEIIFRSEVRDWSTQLGVSSDISLEVAYYNEKLAVWEPLLEPVEVDGKHRPWEITAQVATNNNDEIVADEDEVDAVVLPNPKMTITVESQDILQLTMSKTCMDVLSKLGKAFGDAYNLVEIKEKSEEIESPYIIKNDTGKMIQVKLDDTFRIPSHAKDMHIDLDAGTKVSLFNSEEQERLLSKKSIIKTTQEDQLKTIVLLMEEFGATRQLHIVKAEKRAFNINHRAYPGDTWQIIAQTSASYGCKTITFRSMLQIHNNLQFGIELYYRQTSQTKTKCGEIDAGGVLNVPLEAIYSAPYELYFKPTEGYGEATRPIIWKNLKDGGWSTVKCPGTLSDSPPLYFQC